MDYRDLMAAKDEAQRRVRLCCSYMCIAFPCACPWRQDPHDRGENTATRRTWRSSAATPGASETNERALTVCKC